jgi:hypothetical protein
MVSWLLIIIGIAFVVLVGIAGVLIFHFVRQRRAAAQGGDPVCGQCGYNVRGLPTFTCPECGSDLRTVGIVTPGQRRPLGRLARAVIWTLILPVPALLISFVLLVTVIPMTSDRSDTLDLLWKGSPSGPQVSLQAQGRALVTPLQRGRGRPVPLQRLTLQLPGGWRATTAAPLVIDLRTLGYRCQQPSGDILEQSSGLDASALRAWLAGAGVDVNDALLQSQIPELLRIVQGAAAGTLAPVPGGAWTQVGGGTGTSTHETGWVLLLLVGFWLVVWLAGLWFCIRKRPKAVAAA